MMPTIEQSADPLAGEEWVNVPSVERDEHVPFKGGLDAQSRVANLVTDRPASPGPDVINAAPHTNEQINEDVPSKSGDTSRIAQPKPHQKWHKLLPHHLATVIMIVCLPAAFVFDLAMHVTIQPISPIVVDASSVSLADDHRTDAQPSIAPSPSPPTNARFSGPWLCEDTAKGREPMNGGQLTRCSLHKKQGKCDQAYVIDECLKTCGACGAPASSSSPESPREVAAHHDLWAKSMRAARRLPVNSDWILSLAHDLGISADGKTASAQDIKAIINPYIILGVEVEASGSAISAAYTRVSSNFHPWRHMSHPPRHPDGLELVSEAYRMIHPECTRAAIKVSRARFAAGFRSSGTATSHAFCCNSPAGQPKLAGCDAADQSADQ